MSPKGYKLTEEVKKAISRNRSGIPAWNKGISVSKEQREKLKKIGRLGAKIRWKNHIKIDRTSKYVSYKEKYPNGATERKRFTNMRYKVRKKKAIGSHTFEEWLILKTKYKNMCLCCKMQEPEIKLTEDHIIPLSMGGVDNISNIQPLCINCNSRKHRKVIDFRDINPSEEVRKQIFVN